MTPAAFRQLYAQTTQGQPRAKHDCKPALQLAFVENMGLREAALKTGLPFTAVNIAHHRMRKTIKRNQAQKEAQLCPTNTPSLPN